MLQVLKTHAMAHAENVSVNKQSVYRGKPDQRLQKRKAKFEPGYG